MQARRAHPRVDQTGAVAFCVAAALGATSVTATEPSSPDRLRAVVWGEPVRVASGGGHRGPWRMNQSEYDFVDDATVAMTHDGQMLVAWADHREKDVFVRVLDARSADDSGMPHALNISRSPQTFSWLPRIATARRQSNGANHVFVVWQEIIFSGGSHGGEIFVTRSTDGGKSFAPPQNLSRSKAGDGKGRLSHDDWHNGSFDVTATEAGAVEVAWTDYEGGLWFARSNDSGRTFSGRRAVTPGARLPARGPSLAASLSGQVYLAWTVGEDPSADIYLAVFADGQRGVARAGVAIQCDGRCDAPKLAVDHAGTVHLAYAETERGPGGPSRIRYTRSTDRGRSFEAPRDLPAANGPYAVSGGFPSLAVSGSNGTVPAVIVIWEQFVAPAPDRPREIGFTVSHDGGTTFAGTGVVPHVSSPSLGVNSSQQGLLTRKLATTTDGRFAVANATFKAGASSAVWVLPGWLPRGK